MIHYADTSFLISLYTLEVHSTVAATVMAGIREPILITPFSEVELCNRVQIRVFRQTLTATDASTSLRAFGEAVLLSTFIVQPLSPAVFETAKRLSLRHTATLGFKSLDLMHVASALTLTAIDFLSFDKNQRKLAEAAGLTLVPKTL